MMFGNGLVRKEVTRDSQLLWDTALRGGHPSNIRPYYNEDSLKRSDGG